MKKRKRDNSLNVCLRLPPALHARLMEARGDWMTPQDLIRNILDGTLPPLQNNECAETVRQILGNLPKENK